MTLQEFSDQFDVLWNNIASNQAPGLNEYEKSVFLTKAQAQLVRDYFNRRVDGAEGGFDGSQKRQYDFSSLIRTKPLLEITSYANSVLSAGKIDRRSKVFIFPQDYFLTVNEIISDDRWQYSVLPIDYAEYQRLMLKPYNFPVKRAAWRLITNRANYTCKVIVTLQSKSIINGYDTLPEYNKASSTIYFEGKNEMPMLLTCTQADVGNGKFTISLRLEAEGEGTISTGKELTQAIQEGFKLLGENPDTLANDDSLLVKAARYTNSFASANSVDNFVPQEIDGDTGESLEDTYELNVKVEQLPTIEIIGKFKGLLRYQLRYVKSLKPIILEDLTNYGDDLAIENITEATECELPVETHEEILERAVTLAKIAWQGGTAIQAQAASRGRQSEE